ncbi:MAG: hypothetical protein AAF489_14290 [Bacteroidota bacterium]
MNEYWSVLLLLCAGSILFLGASLGFSWIQDRGNQMGPDAYEGCINTTAGIGAIFLLLFVVVVICGIVGLF